MFENNQHYIDNNKYFLFTHMTNFKYPFKLNLHH